jgi:hypothetical protein
MKPAFIPGLKLAEEFHAEIIAPLLGRLFPGLAYSAARLDSGSEVLGFDDQTSVDHGWGPRLTLFLTEEDFPRYSEQINRALADQLPYEFKGYPTNFSVPTPENGGSQVLEPISNGPVNHLVLLQTVRGFFSFYLGFDITQDLQPVDWLTFSEQRLGTIRAGAVFHDELGLEAVRLRFTYYPQDVWLYLLAAAWRRIGQEDHLMGRAGMVADEVGSALIGARLVRDCMRLCFLMERTYAPYAKWFGSAFKQLSCAASLWPVFQGALHAETWQPRESYLVRAYEELAARHNALKVTASLPDKVAAFYERPLKVISQNGFEQALLKAIQDPAVKRIAALPLIGNLDMFSDNVDLVSDPTWRPRLRQLFGAADV